MPASFPFLLLHISHSTSMAFLPNVTSLIIRLFPNSKPVFWITDSCALSAERAGLSFANRKADYSCARYRDFFFPILIIFWARLCSGGDGVNDRLSSVAAPVRGDVGDV